MHSPTISFHQKYPVGQVSMLTRVLVVDDDSETTDLLKILLESNAFEVITTTSGQEAVKLAQKRMPEVMIVDLLMPDMDGLSVCKEVRKFSNVPILVPSAISKPGIVAQALEAGADDYLIKPMKGNVLIAYLNRLARRARAELEVSRADGVYRMM